MCEPKKRESAAPAVVIGLLMAIALGIYYLDRIAETLAIAAGALTVIAAVSVLGAWRITRSRRLNSGLVMLYVRNTQNTRNAELPAARPALPRAAQQAIEGRVLSPYVSRELWARAEVKK